MNTELLTMKGVAGGPGIDYSRGLANVNKEPGPNQGIHVGVISQNECLQTWAGESEPYYGEPIDCEIECPECGHCFTLQPREAPADMPDMAVPQWAWGDLCACPKCAHEFDLELCEEAEPIGYDLNDGEYLAFAGDDGDIMITASPYYTHCHFCSPCAPGAGYLMQPFKIPKGYQDTARTLTEISPDTEGDLYKTLAEAAGFPKVFCFGHDWFDAVKQGDKPCDWCNGTGKRNVHDIGIANFNIEHFTKNGGTIIDEKYLECWVCHGKRFVDNMVSKAPYRVFDVMTGKEVKP